MGEGKRVQKKEITAGTTVKAVITGYIAYGILMGFICFIISFLVNWYVNQVPTEDHRALSIILPILGVCLLYFVMHGVCKLSIYDVFKKCKTNPNKNEKIFTRLNLFILICVFISVVLVILILTMNFSNERKAIEIASYQYNTIHSKQFATILTNEMKKQFNEEKTNTLISTIIFEMGITFIYFSLIPYQKKLIEKYNEF